MYAVEIHLPRQELPRQMYEMRIWLDQNRFESSTFSCRDGDYDVLVSVEFRAPRQAAAFAERFAGRANERSIADPEERSAGQILEIGLKRYAVGG
jgi:hypothetical protein